jgi:hypothetical protein
MTWTHNACGVCWVRYYRRDFVGTISAGHQQDICCFCGFVNTHGIYVRIDPNDARLTCKGKHIGEFDDD